MRHFGAQKSAILAQAREMSTDPRLNGVKLTSVPDKKTKQSNVGWAKQPNLQ